MKLTGFNRNLSEPTPKERELFTLDLQLDDPQDFEIDEAEKKKLQDDLNAKVIQVDQNTNQKLIVVTQDKTLLTLKRNLARLGKREWVAPLSTSLTILITLITSNFRFALGLGPAEWRAMFIISGFVSCGWLAYSVNKSIKAKSFQEVVNDIVFELGARKRYVTQAE